MEKQEGIELATRIANGEATAENELFFRYAERIKFIVRVGLKGVALEEQEDLVSEIQEIVLCRLREGRFDPERGKALGAYIAGIADIAVAEYYRKRNRAKIVQTGLPEDVPIDSDNVLSHIITEERTRKLNDCLRKLKPKHKEVLLLKYYEEISVKEIAEKLSLPPRRVSERIHYAIKLLLKECKKENFFNI